MKITIEITAPEFAFLRAQQTTDRDFGKAAQNDLCEELEKEIRARLSETENEQEDNFGDDKKSAGHDSGGDNE